MNSMDQAVPAMTAAYWVDVAGWTLGAVVLNQALLGHLWPGTGNQAEAPSNARRWTLLVAGAGLLVLLSAATSALSLVVHGGPCALNAGWLALLLLVSPLLFAVHAAWLQVFGPRVLGPRAFTPVLVISALLLAAVLAWVRDVGVVPLVCHGGSHAEYRDAY